MSNPFTKQQIQERYDALPEDIQKVVAGDTMVKQLEVIGRNHNLRIDGIGILIEYSGLIMLGLIKSNEFVRHLRDQLNLSQEQAEQIAIEVDEQVFSRIRESLRKIQYRSTDEARFGEVEIPLPSSNPYRKEGEKDNSFEDISVEEALKHTESGMVSSGTDFEKALDQEGIVIEDSNTKQEDTESVIEENQDALNQVSHTDTDSLEFVPSKSAQADQSPAIDGGEQQTQSQESPKQEVPHISPTGLENRGVDINFDAGETALEAQIEAREQASALHAYQSMGGEQRANPGAQAQAGFVGSGIVPPTGGAGQEMATPTIEADPEKMKDFQTLLKEQISKQDTSKFDNDPYRESITD
ncbi:MAG: hypothetical protein ACKKL4_02490 [Patescibacteria group bacterium]